MELTFKKHNPFLGSAHPVDLPVYSGPLHTPVEIVLVDPTLANQQVFGVVTNSEGTRRMMSWPLEGGGKDDWNALHYSDIEPSINWDHIHEAYRVLEVADGHAFMSQGLDEETEHWHFDLPFKVYHLRVFSSFCRGLPSHPAFGETYQVFRPGYNPD